MASRTDVYTTKVFLNAEEAKKQLDVMSKKVEEFRKLRDSSAKEGNGEMAANYAKEIAYFSFSESALFAADAVHFLGEAALRDEVLFKSLQLFEEQVVGLVDEDDSHVGDGLRRPRLAEIHEEFGIVVLLAQPAHGRPFHGILFTLAFMLVTITANAQSNPQSYLSCPDSKHPHLIDLGLPSGTKWACCNVDDDPSKQSPTSNGSYYAWGETKEHEIKVSSARKQKRMVLFLQVNQYT